MSAQKVLVRQGRTSGEGLLRRPGAARERLLGRRAVGIHIRIVGVCNEGAAMTTAWVAGHGG